jgi:hypothetical protein
MTHAELLQRYEQQQAKRNEERLKKAFYTAQAEKKMLHLVAIQAAKRYLASKGK